MKGGDDMKTKINWVFLGAIILLVVVGAIYALYSSKNQPSLGPIDDKKPTVCNCPTIKQACVDYKCNPDGSCKQTRRDYMCTTTNPCKKGICDSQQGCMFQDNPDGTYCRIDGLGSGSCKSGTCIIPDSPKCTTDADCKGGNSCQKNACTGGKCQAAGNYPDGTSCEDKFTGNKGTCQGGQCVQKCTDDSQCSKDSWDKQCRVGHCVNNQCYTDDREDMSCWIGEKRGKCDSYGSCWIR